MPHHVSFAGTMFSIFFTDTQVHDFTGAAAQDTAAYAAFFQAMLAGGVYLPPSAFEVWFVSGAHNDAATDQILAALPGAAEAAARAGQERP